VPPRSCRGIQFYKDTADDALIPGIMHARLSGYPIRDIKFTMGIEGMCRST